MREDLIDNQLVRDMKGLIRKSEAKIAVNSLGVESKDVFSLDLPFYTHHSKRKLPGEDD